MNISLQQMKPAEVALRHTITTRLTGANRSARTAEARQLLAEKAELVEALRRLVAVLDAAGHAGCAGGAGVVHYREQLAIELADLERLQNVAAVFDELFGGEKP